MPRCPPFPAAHASATPPAAARPVVVFRSSPRRPPSGDALRIAVSEQCQMPHQVRRMEAELMITACSYTNSGNEGGRFDRAGCFVFLPTGCRLPAEVTPFTLIAVFEQICGAADIIEHRSADSRRDL